MLPICYELNPSSQGLISASPARRKPRRVFFSPRRDRKYQFHTANNRNFSLLERVVTSVPEIDIREVGTLMRNILLILCATFWIGGPAFSQGKPQPRSSVSPPTDAASDEKAAEIRRSIELGQARQRGVDARNTRIWRRWDFAVCIGCGPMPKGFRMVYTTPARVLAGFIAADDDERRMRGLTL